MISASWTANKELAPYQYHPHQQEEGGRLPRTLRTLNHGVPLGVRHSIDGDRLLDREHPDQCVVGKDLLWGGRARARQPQRRCHQHLSCPWAEGRGTRCCFIDILKGFLPVRILPNFTELEADSGPWMWFRVALVGGYGDRASLSRVRGFQGRKRCGHLTRWGPGGASRCCGHLHTGVSRWSSYFHAMCR